jgi:hypothetical protein
MPGGIDRSAARRNSANRAEIGPFYRLRARCSWPRRAVSGSLAEAGQVSAHATNVRKASGHCPEFQTRSRWHNVESFVRGSRSTNYLYMHPTAATARDA